MTWAERLRVAALVACLTAAGALESTLGAPAHAEGLPTVPTFTTTAPSASNFVDGVRLDLSQVEGR